VKEGRDVGWYWYYILINLYQGYAYNIIMYYGFFYFYILTSNASRRHE
jgi:hypothetical protein